MRRTLSFITLILIMSGCANPIASHVMKRYADAAYSNLHAGDWVTAQMQFGRAIVNARQGKTDDRTLAILLYEYGRASGVICNWAESEKSSIAAYELDRENDGPTHMSLFELGRMHSGRQEFSKAVEYFNKVLPEFKNLQAEARDPIGYAEFLEEYSLALDQTGKDDSAKIHRMRARAKELRSTFPNANAFSEKTPYGTQCQKNQHETSKTFGLNLKENG